MRVPAPERFEHDADVAWRDGPLRALAELGDLDVRGVSVAAMVPSLAAVDASRARRSPPGLLYGDERGRTGDRTRRRGTDDASGGFLGYVRWLRGEVPDAHGFWPAQAVANHASSGEAVLDTTTASLAHPLFDWVGWDEQRWRASSGSAATQLPRLVPTGWEAGRIGGDGPALASGCIDAMAEQLVAGADQPGDVLVLLGTTLIVWVVADEGGRGPGLREHPAHRVGQLPRGRAEQRRRHVPRLGDAPVRAGGGPRRSTRVRSRCGRRTRAASASRSTTRRAERCSSARPHPRRRPRSCARPTRRRRSS